MIAGPVRFRHFLWVLAAIAAVYALYSAWVVGVRVQYPYDHFIWSESPFLTNMLKLHNGVALYGPPSDANSFVYSPGLEYLCYAILSPFDLHLDLRACRAVNVGVGVFAVAAATQFMLASVDRDNKFKGIDRAAVAILFASTAGLVLLKNFTFDVCHPDNLHALHLAAGIAMGARALDKESFGWSVLTAAVLGFGILLKQTCALGGLGIAVFLALAGRSWWGWRKSALIVGASIATMALSAWWLLVHHAHGSYWLYEVLMQHDKVIGKLEYLWGHDLVSIHRMPLYFGAVYFGLVGLTETDRRKRARVGLWLFAGVFGAFPGVLGYIKKLGLYNNIVVIDLWAAMLVVPRLYEWCRTGLDLNGKRANVVAASVLTILVVGLYPVKRAPLSAHYRYGRELEKLLTEDIAAGRKVLVAHGTAAWIRAGLRTVPLDRSNSVLELDIGGDARRAHTAKRFQGQDYDRIYIGWPRYSERIEGTLGRRYVRMATRVDGVPLPDLSPACGWVKEMSPIIQAYQPKR